MLDKKKLACGVGAVLAASFILMIVAIVEYNFWWDYTSPIKQNRNLVEIVAAIKEQEETEYGTLHTTFEYVYQSTVYQHDTFLITEKASNVIIYVDQTDPTNIVFREPFGQSIMLVSGASLFVVAVLLFFAVAPIYHHIFGEDKKASNMKW